MAVRCTGGVFFATMSEGVHGRRRSHAFGLVVTFGSLGAFFGNWLFGILREVTGTFSGGIAVMMMTSVVAYLASGLRAPAR